MTNLPFVTEADVKEQGLQMLCVSQGDVARVVTLPTSGTTGPPKRVWFTEDDLELTVEHFHHGMKDLVGPGDCVLVLMPGEQPGTVGALLKTALERSGVETIVYGLLDDTDAVGRLVEERNVDCLVGVPGQVLTLARSRAGRNIAPDRLKSVLLSGDYVSSPLRKAIETTWGCSVFEHYGSTEMGLGRCGAVQSVREGGTSGRRIFCSRSWTQSPADRCPTAKRARSSFTTLTREGMPMLRYRTGDRAGSSPPLARVAACSVAWTGSAAAWLTLLTWATGPRWPWRIWTRLCTRFRG